MLLINVQTVCHPAALTLTRLFVATTTACASGSATDFVSASVHCIVALAFFSPSVARSNTF